MNKEEKLDTLQNLDEKTFTKRILIPFFPVGMGCKNVQYTHRILELRIDIIHYTEDEFDGRINTGVQVKTEKIETKDISELLRQEVIYNAKIMDDAEVTQSAEINYTYVGLCVIWEGESWIGRFH